MKKAMVLKTWSANLLCYTKAMENGKINKDLRKDSFSDWIDILVENLDITENQAESFKSEISGEELCEF